ncbi:MAG TPA: MarR family winged helix-turn-helix transcriptional regulator [Ignavibacteria bacterium]
MMEKIIEIIFELKSSCNEKELLIRNKLKLSPAEFRGILVLTPGKINPCKELCSKMGLSASRGSRVVEKLMKNGYLKEVKNNIDRRVMNITLTVKGIKTHGKITSMLNDCEKEISKKISRSERSSLVNSLSKIKDVLAYK